MSRTMLSDDISNGIERAKIAVFNDFDDCKLPAFDYESKCLFDRTMNSSIASVGPDFEENQRSACCIDVCRSNCPCASGFFDNNVISSLDHLNTIIKECGPACVCASAGCSNRLTQQGTRFRFEIFRTYCYGWGVRALCSIPVRAIIGEYVGKVIFGSPEQNDYSYATLYDKLDVTIDASKCGNFTRFINHSCRPNVFSARIKRTGDPLIHMVLFAIRNIQEGEQITLDYGEEWWGVMRAQYSVKCLCDSDSCRYS